MNIGTRKLLCLCLRSISSYWRLKICRMFRFLSLLTVTSLPPASFSKKKGNTILEPKTTLYRNSLTLYLSIFYECDEGLPSLIYLYSTILPIDVSARFEMGLSLNLMSPKLYPLHTALITSGELWDIAIHCSWVY